jgi:branched-chain amino acid transport system substrate-binding protein
MKKVTGILGIVLFLIFIVTPAVNAAELPKVIKMGGQGVTSGSKADYGHQMIMGAQMAVEEINNSGGILGSKVEMKFMDTELKAAVATKNARYLVKDWGAHFLFGIDSSGVSMALAPIMPELDRILIICHGATHKVNEEAIFKKGLRNTFRISVPTYQDGTLPAMIFKDRPEIKRIASLAAAYSYGYSAWEMFEKTLKKYRPDVEVVGKAEAPFLHMDFTPQLNALMAAKPDLILATPWGGEGLMMLRQAILLGLFEQPWFKVWFQCMGGSIDMAEGLTPDVKGGKFHGKLWATARYLWNWPDTPRNKEFVAKFRDKFGRFPNYSAANVYTAIFTFKKAVEQTKSLDTQKLIKALEGMKVQAPDGERWIRPEDHQACYTVPAGHYVYDSAVCPNAYLSDLVVIPWEKYYRNPPDYKLP